MSRNSFKLQSRGLSSEKTSTRAFTFMEVVIALAIVSISLLSLIRLHVININMMDSAEKTSQAAFLAQEKIAEILAAGFPDKGSYRGTFESNSSLFSWNTVVEDVQLPQLDNEKLVGLREISVEISWQQGTGKKHLRMSTLVADRKIL